MPDKYFLSPRTVRRILNYKDTKFGDLNETGTLTTRTGEANAVGTYIATDRQTDCPSKWIPQGMNVSLQGRMVKTDISSPLCARGYKGVSGRDLTTVVAYGKDKSKKCDK